MKTLSVALADALGSEAVIARLGGDEFAVALALDPEEMSRADALAETVLQTVTRPLLLPQSASAFAVDAELVESRVYLVWGPDDGEPKLWKCSGTDSVEFKSLESFLRWHLK